MNAPEFFQEVRSKYPALSKKADIEHQSKYSDERFEFISLWFESFANSLNSEMNLLVDPGVYIELFEYFSKKFETGNAEIKHHIGVAFVENLFWHVSLTGAQLYWSIIPKNLQILYINFHGKKPF